MLSEADPVPPIVRARLFYYFMPQGRFEEAVQEIETALKHMCAAWRDEVASTIRKGHAKDLINQWKLRNKMTAARPT